MRLPIVLAVITGCAQPNWPALVCESHSSRVLALDETASAGFTPEELVLALEQVLPQEFEVSGGSLESMGVIPAELTIEPAEDLHPISEMYDGGCTPYVSLQVRMTWRLPDLGVTVHGHTSANVYGDDVAGAYGAIHSQRIEVTPGGPFDDLLVANGLTADEVEAYLRHGPARGSIFLRELDPDVYDNLVVLDPVE